MKKQFDFIGKRRVVFAISIALFVLGILLSFVIGVDMDISFKGGTLVKYSYTGTLDKDAVQTLANDKMGSGTTVELTQNGDTQIISMTRADVLTPDQQDALLDAFQTTFKDNKIESIQVNSLEASMGRSFFAKCLVAVALAAIFLIVYVGLRFRKIGGFSAGVMAVYALLNDLMVAYLAFVIFRIPLNDNFVAVILTILGYSLNDTIVIFDRIRENRAKMGKEPIDNVVNLSLNQTLGRAISTSISTVIAITCVAVVALIMDLDSVLSFAVPMLFGLISGSYTSIFLCTPVWAQWVKHSEKRAAEKAALKKKKKA